MYGDRAHAVYGYALRLTREWATAEAITHETFLTAWQARSRVEARGELPGPCHVAPQEPLLRPTLPGSHRPGGSVVTTARATGTTETALKPH
ncbi:RNA polymerase sigma factor [Streptomyces pratensis]|uniref:RNA polymerase sigma factor n=1 Tax=Streptomyces pratensis TaxID=1169025 RepID=UPI003625ACB1